MEPRSRKLPFDAMAGLPADDDEEVTALTDTLAHLPRDSIDGLTRYLLRAAVAQERSGEVAHLTRLAEDMLTTVRLHEYLATDDVADTASSARDGKSDM